MNNTDLIISFLDGIKCRYISQALLSEYTTFRTGGRCSVMVFPDTKEKIISLVKYFSNNSVKYFVIGKGSNLIAEDEGYDGIILNLCDYDYYALIDNNTVLCSAGISLIKVCRFALENSLTGLEFAYGIPGSVGGAVYMNAGAYGGEIKDVVEEVEYVDCKGNIGIYTSNELNFGYRHSVFTSSDKIVLNAKFILSSGNADDIKEKMDSLMQKRRDKQPLEYPSAGSTFKRPEGYFAGALIEECGLKGFTVGGAAVSEKHAGFIINKGNATSADIFNVIDHCRETVMHNKGVMLKAEVRIIK